MLDFLSRRRGSRVAFALFTVLASAILRWLLSPVLGYHSGLILFVPAVMAATWYGGLWPGLAALVLGAVVGESAEAQPLTILSLHNHEAIRVVLFMLVGLQIAWSIDLLHRRTGEAYAAIGAKDHFISILSHELRTPLAPALLVAGELCGDPRLSDAVRQQAGIIARNIALEVRLIDDLLDSSRIRKGKLHLKCEIVELEQVVREAIATCQQIIAAKHLHVRMDSDGGPYYVNADPVRLQQVFWNLLRNAVKFTPDGGAIALNITAGTSGMVSAQVTDTGIGIAAENLPRIFEAFEQGGAAVTRQFGGLGLGLAITHALVERHGGTIIASSPGVGRGASFVVTLPESPHPPLSVAKAPTTSAKTHAPRRQRLLYVEDHGDTAQVMTRLLERLGYQVIAASTVRAALDAAANGAFDLIISDRALPDGEGCDILTAMAARGQVPPAIALTGFGMEEDRRKSVKAGFAAHLVKPVDISELQRTIDRLLSGEHSTMHQTV